MRARRHCLFPYNRAAPTWWYPEEFLDIGDDEEEDDDDESDEED